MEWKTAKWHGTLMQRVWCEITDWLGWLFCEIAFKTDCRGTGWAYRLGNWFYGCFDKWKLERTETRPMMEKEELEARSNEQLLNNIICNCRTVGVRQAKKQSPENLWFDIQEMKDELLKRLNA
jgi:hypothetical protein